MLYCRSGRRSSLAQERLLEMGYRHVINAGGYQTWRAARRTLSPARTNETGRPAAPRFVVITPSLEQRLARQAVLFEDFPQTF